MRRIAGTAAALVLAVAACGGGDGIDVEGVWARTSPAMADAGAVYLEVTSSDADRLVGALVDPSVAATVELHETVMVDGEMSGDSSPDEGMSDEDTEHAAGAMTMQEVGVIDLPAGETVALEPGGLHIMLLDLAAPLELGEEFDLTLQFENGGEQVVPVEVRDEAP
jgi:copper(I)-binding protein